MTTTPAEDDHHRVLLCPPGVVLPQNTTTTTRNNTTTTTATEKAVATRTVFALDPDVSAAKRGVTLNDSKCRVHTSCQRADCEFRRLPWELSAQVEVQRRCALNLKRRNERSLRIGSNGRGNGAFVDEDDDVEEDYHITQEHLNQCIKEQKEKEHAIQESFKKDVLNAMPKEIGAKVDPKTGRILERIERGVQRGAQRRGDARAQLHQSRRARKMAARKQVLMLEQQKVHMIKQQQQQQHRQLNTINNNNNNNNNNISTDGDSGNAQESVNEDLMNMSFEEIMDDSDESEDDCIDNDGSADGGARACENCDATRSTRWHEHEVENRATDARGRKTNEVIGTVITLTCEDCHVETLKKATQEYAARSNCARCDEESERGEEDNTDAKTQNPRNYYEGANGDTLCLKCYRVDYEKYILNLRQEREKVKKEESNNNNKSKFLANRAGVRLKNAPKWARTSILQTTYGIAILPPPEGAKEYSKDWCACCERPKDPESRSQWGMSKTVYGASLCHNCYRVELEGFKKHGCVVCSKSWETNLYFRSKMNVHDFLCKDCFVAEKRKMFPELCVEERDDDATTTTTTTAAAATTTIMNRSFLTPAQRNHNKKGRKCCICAADQTSLAGWYFMRNEKNERVDGKYSCNRCYANFCRPGRPERSVLSADKIRQALTTSNGVIRYDMSEARTTVANYTFSTSGPAPRPKIRPPRTAIVAPTPKNKVVKKQHQQSSHRAHSQKIKTGPIEAAFQSDDDADDDEDLIKCVSCLKGNNPKKLVLCDGCDAGHHTYCIGLARVPAASRWFCPACTKREAQKESLTCTEAHPCVACGCVDETIENYTPEPIKSIDCFCRLCFERYHANIRNEISGSRLSLDELLSRVFDKLPKKTKSEEAKAIDNVTISDKKNKWSSEQEWEKRVSATSGLDAEAQTLSTCWLPPPETKVRVRLPVARFTPVDESAVVKKVMPAAQAMPPPPPRPRPPPSIIPPPPPPPPPPLPPSLDTKKENNRKSAQRSRNRLRALAALRNLKKNKNKTDEELISQLPKDLQPRPKGAGSHRSPSLPASVQKPPAIVVKKPTPSPIPSYNTQMEVMSAPNHPHARQSVSSMPSISLVANMPSDTPKEERIREALYRSNGRKKFVKEMLKRPEHKCKTEYELFAMLPEDLQFRQPPPGFSGIVVRHNTETDKNTKVHSSTKKRKSVTPTPPTSKVPQVEQPTRKRPKLPAGSTEVAHRDGRTCVTCRSKTTPYGDWYRTEKGNENCKTYFCSRCAKIPANRLARGGVLTKKDIEKLADAGQQQPKKDELLKKKGNGFGVGVGILKKIWTTKK